MQLEDAITPITRYSPHQIDPLVSRESNLLSHPAGSIMSILSQLIATISKALFACICLRHVSSLYRCGEGLFGGFLWD